MKFLVLGSEGLIGSAFCSLLDLKKIEYIRWDIKLNPKDHDLRESFNILKLQEAVNKCDYILFAAYDVGGSKYININNTETLDNNLKIMLNTFKVLINKKFVFLSTQMIHTANNFYGESKRIGELYTKNLGGINARLYNVYGKQIPSLKSYVITDLISQAKTNGIINLKTRGDEERQFLHADDCAKMILHLFFNYDLFKSYDFIDFTSYKWTSILEVTNILKKFFPNLVVNLGTQKNIQQKIEPLHYELFKDFKCMTLEEGIKKILDDKNSEYEYIETYNKFIPNLISKTLNGKGDSDKHLFTLFSIVLQLNAKNILELGVRNGDTTLPLLLGANITNGQLTSVDIEDTNFECPSELVSKWTFKKSDAISFLNQKVEKPWDLIYIDDWHSYEHVKKELEIIDTQITPKTVILLHDLMYANYEPKYHTDLSVKTGQWANGGPYRAVAELDTNFWEFSTIPVNNGLTILRKKYSKLYFQ